MRWEPQTSKKKVSCLLKHWDRYTRQSYPICRSRLTLNWSASPGSIPCPDRGFIVPAYLFVPVRRSPRWPLAGYTTWKLHYGSFSESTKCSRLEIIPRENDRMSIINDALSRVENVRNWLIDAVRGFTLTYGIYKSKGKSITSIFSIYSTSKTKSRSTSSSRVS